MNIEGKDAGTKVEKAQQKSPTIYNLIQSTTDEFGKALPAHVDKQRFVRIAMTAIRTNPKLGQANPTSLMGALMTCAQLGLECNTPLGQAYLIPYGSEVQFQLGYKGLLDLAYRSKQYKRINARVVDKADEFAYEYGLDERLHHKPSAKPTGESVYYYAVYELDNGGKSFVVWSKQKVEDHAKKFSKAFTSGPWKTNFDAMACKTVLLDLLKSAPKSTEAARAVASDNMTIRMDMDDPEHHLDVEADFEEV
jgi:recombination protein RecT